MAFRSARARGHLRTRIGPSVTFCERGQVWEQVELLEDHADLAPDRGDVADVVRQLDAVDDDLAALVLLQPVDRPDEGRLARAGRAEDDQHLARLDGQVDATQDVQLAEPLVDVAADDDAVAWAGRRASGRLRVLDLVAHRVAHAHLLLEPVARLRHRVAQDEEHDRDENVDLQMGANHSGWASTERPIASSSSSPPPATTTSVVSLSRLMNRPTLAGMTARSACGSTMYRLRCRR